MFAKNLQKRETSCRKLVQDFRQSMVTTAIILKSRNSFSEVLYWLLKTLSTVTIFQWKAIENQRKLLKIWTTLRQTKLSEKRCWRLNLRCQKLFSIVTKNTTTVVKNESVLNFSKLLEMLLQWIKTGLPWIKPTISHLRRSLSDTCQNTYEKWHILS